MGSIHLINSAFLSVKIIVSTLTDVGNANFKHQSITSQNQIKKTQNLAFRCECSSRFQDTAASKLQLTSSQGQLYRSSKMSPTLFQTDVTKTGKWARIKGYDDGVSHPEWFLYFTT